MILTKELIESILESRDSLIVTADGIDYTITEASEIPFNVEAIKEAYEFHELFERVQIKRKYGQYEAHKVNRGAPIRNKIVEFVGKKFITDEEMKDYLLRLEEEKGSSINKTQWFSRNGKYFESFENRGQKVWTLSKFGKRVLEYIIKSENEDTKKINENMSKIGLFKLVNESSITESVYLDKHGELSSYDKKNFTEIGRHTITLGKDLAAIILFGYSTRNWKGKNEFVAEVTCTSYSIDVRDLGNSYGSIISSETFGTEEDAKFKATNLFKSFKVK